MSLVKNNPFDKVTSADELAIYLMMWLATQEGCSRDILEHTMYKLGYLLTPVASDIMED